jgi:hypothetical protein
MLLQSLKRSALYGARLTERKIRVTAACRAAPSLWLAAVPRSAVPSLRLAATLRSAALGGWLLSRSCGWLLPFVLLHLAAGGWLLPSPCGWLLPLILLHMAAGCCPVPAGGCCLSFCCTWPLAAGPSLRLAATPFSPSQGRNDSLLSAHRVDGRIEIRPPLRCVVSRDIVER